MGIFKGLFGRFSPGAEAKDIKEFLETLIERRASLSVKVKDKNIVSTTEFTTIIVKLISEQEGGGILVDELMPREQSVTLNPGAVLLFEHVTGGITSKFSVEVIKEAEGVSRCTLPTAIKQTRARANKRYDVNISDRGEARLFSSSRKPVICQIKNISNSGAQLLVKTSPPIFPPLAKGDFFDDSHLNLLGKKTIELSVQIVTIELSKNRLYSLIGVKFNKFKSKEHEERLELVLRQLDENS